MTHGHMGVSKIGCRGIRDRGDIEHPFLGDRGPFLGKMGRGDIWDREIWGMGDMGYRGPFLAWFQTEARRKNRLPG